MKTNNIDSQFKSEVERNQDFYNEQAENSKLLIWQSVQKGVNKNSSRYIIFSLSAACVCLIALSSILWLKLQSSTNIYQTEATSTLRFSHKQIIESTSTEALTQIKSNKKQDTIYIYKQQIFYQPIENTLYKTDTVFITEYIYTAIDHSTSNTNIVEIEPENETSTFSPNNKNIIFSSEASQQKTKTKRFKFGFGSSNTDVNSGTLAITTKL